VSSTSGSCSLCPIWLYISTDKDIGLGVWSVVWRHGALAAGSEGRLSLIWGVHGHISFWSGGIHSSMVQFVRHAVFSSRLLEYLQNNRLVSSEDCYLDIYFSYTCAMLFNASGQAV